MSTKYEKGKDVPTDVLVKRLHELSDAVARGIDSSNLEFMMSVPPEEDSDADLVIAEAACRLVDIEASNLLRAKADIRAAKMYRVAHGHDYWSGTDVEMVWLMEQLDKQMAETGRLRDALDVVSSDKIKGEGQCKSFAKVEADMNRPVSNSKGEAIAVRYIGPVEDGYIYQVKRGGEVERHVQYMSQEKLPSLMGGVEMKEVGAVDDPLLAGEDFKKSFEVIYNKLLEAVGFSPSSLENFFNDTFSKEFTAKSNIEYLLAKIEGLDMEVDRLSGELSSVQARYKLMCDDLAESKSLLERQKKSNVDSYREVCRVMELFLKIKDLVRFGLDKDEEGYCMKSDEEGNWLDREQVLALINGEPDPWGSGEPKDDLPEGVIGKLNGDGLPDWYNVLATPVDHVRRYDDMSPRGMLEVFRQDDGDYIIQVTADPDEFKRGTNGTAGSFSIEFCTPMMGGGQSSRTHVAVANLMRAIYDDNEERPQNREGD